MPFDSPWAWQPPGHPMSFRRFLRETRVGHANYGLARNKRKKKCAPCADCGPFATRIDIAPPAPPFLQDTCFATTSMAPGERARASRHALFAQFPASRPVLQASRFRCAAHVNSSHALQRKASASDLLTASRVTDLWCLPAPHQRLRAAARRTGGRVRSRRNCP